MTEKKCNTRSFFKMLLWMAIGACCGAILGIGTFLMEDGLKGFFRSVYSIISDHAGVLLIGLALFSLVFSVFCYMKGNHYAELAKLAEEEEQQDVVDEKFDFGLNIGLTTSSIVIYVSLAIFAFQESMREIRTMESGLFAVVIALFGDMFFGGGLTAIILLTACNIIVSVAYCYYTMKLGRSGVKA